MSEIDEIYRQRVDAMTVAEKFERMLALNEWAHWNIARRITEREGPQTPEVVKWKVALEIYGRNPVCRELIEGQLAKVEASIADLKRAGTRRTGD